MDINSGNTFRRVPDYCPSERTLFVQSSSPLEIIGNTFVSGVSYSINKGKRWQILPLISKNIMSEQEVEFTEDQSVRCSIIQKLSSRRSVKAHYLVDSDVHKEIGSRNLSDHKFNGGSFNLHSVIKNWEQFSGEKSKKEINTNKSIHNRNSIVEKVLDNKFSSKDSFISALNKELLVNNNSKSDFSIEKDHVYIEEIVPVNNPYDTKPYVWHPQRWKRKQYKKIDIDDFTIEIEDYIDEDDNGKIPDQIVHDSCIRKPFVFNENDLVYTNKSNQSKKRKRKFQKKFKYTNANKKDLNGFVNLETNEYSSGVTADSLPFILITLSHELLVKELKSISVFCHCWSSKTSPEMILIDVDYIRNVSDKSYIVLKPVDIVNDKITVKITLNLQNYDYNKIFDNAFLSVLELLTFIQSTIDQIENPIRSTDKFHLLKLDKPVDNLFNTWSTEIIELVKPIFCLNEEWEKYEFRMNEIDFENISKFTEKKLCCEICSKDFLINELIIMKVCEHRICEKCFTSYLTNQITNDLHCLNCPISNCSVTLDCVSILSLIPFKQYQIRIKKLENEIIKGKGCQCHFCNSVLIKSENSVATFTKQFEYLCNCGVIICGVCGNRQHWPTSCDNMKNHYKQLVKLEDKNIDLKPKSVTVEGRFCTKCNKFFLKTDLRYIMCTCYTYFCYTCGFTGYGYHEDCSTDTGHVKLKIDIAKHGQCPEPDSLRPKYYCESINVRLMLEPSNISRLKRQLFKIDSKIKDCSFLNIDRENVLVQYYQILKIIESIYILNYQSNQKTQSTSGFLRIAAKNLMFFIHQFQSLIDQLNSAVCKKDETQISKTEILRKRKMINIYLNDAISLVSKCSIFIC